ncbi:hypothetical protein IK7_05914, partial [Bacillus cereus VD156]|uniref:polysaccharide deacetylase family protein n=1 Tax=Bacillus cereus TaxID=1396 RepID=UPI000279A4ED
MSKNPNKKSVQRALLTLMLILTTTFLMFFIIGKFNSAPVKGTTHEGKNNQIVMQHSKEKKIEKEIEKTNPQKEKKADGKPIGKFVYLTFDDGPSTLTGKFLDVLKENDVKATFFM